MQMCGFDPLTRCSDACRRYETCTRNPKNRDKDKNKDKK